MPFQTVCSVLKSSLTLCLTGVAVLVASCGGFAPPLATAPPVVIAPPPLPKKLVLALGGGAARGFAHIGVLEVLHEHGFKPAGVVGTSAGSLVAALYAAGKSPAELRQTALALNEAEITDFTLPIFGRGLIKGEALAKYVSTHTRGLVIEKSLVPLGITATDLKTGEPILFQLGDMGSAVRASSAVPGVFQPVRIADKDYVDGGLVSPVPVRYAKQLLAGQGVQAVQTVVLAVDISSIPEGNPTNDAFGVLMQTFAIMGKGLNKAELQEAALAVRPDLSGVKSADFSAKQRSMDAGRAAMLQALPQLRVLMETR